MRIDSSELARVQGNLCVSAYRLLRGIHKSITDIGSTNERYESLKETYEEYCKVTGSKMKNISTPDKAVKKCKEIMSECNATGFNLSHFWERKVGEHTYLKYGTFRKIKITKAGNVYLEYTVVGHDINTGNEEEIAIMSVTGTKASYFTLDGTEDNYESDITFNGDTFKYYLLGIFDPWDTNNVAEYFDDRTIMVYSYDNAMTMLTFRSPKLAARYSVSTQYARADARDEMADAVIDFFSIFDGLSSNKIIEMVGQVTNPNTKIVDWTEFWAVRLVQYMIVTEKDIKKKMELVDGAYECNAMGKYTGMDFCTYDVGDEDTGKIYSGGLDEMKITLTDSLLDSVLTKEERNGLNDLQVHMLFVIKKCRAYKKKVLQWIDSDEKLERRYFSSDKDFKYIRHGIVDRALREELFRQE